MRLRALIVLIAPTALTVPTAEAQEGGHWAFQPVRNPPVPATRHVAENPVDAFVFAALEEVGLTPGPPADPRTLLRRVTFDLTGLPPTPEEIDAFLADGAPDAYERAVDRLLASPRYGERWGRHWLDVARYADTKGNVYGTVEPRFIHSDAYRDWVIGAFNDDLPYDEFLILQIAADRVAGEEDPGALAAMGFLTLGERFLQNPHDIIDDRIDVVTRGTLALTVSCARCHDHEYDPIPTEDYYSLYGVFDASALARAPLGAVEGEFAEGLLERETRYRERFDEAAEGVLGHLRSRAGDYLRAVLDVARLRTEEFVVFADTSDVNPVIVRRWWDYLNRSDGDARNRAVFDPWRAFARLEETDLAAGVARWIAEHGDETNPLVAQAFAADPPRTMREVADRYGALFAAVLSDEPLPDPAAEELRQVLYGSGSPIDVFDGELEEVEWSFRETVREELRALLADVDRWILQSPGAPPWTLYLADRPAPASPRVFRRGNPADRGAEVPRRFLAVLSDRERTPFPEGSGRLSLARAIADPENPLTARVWVNRVWLHHFGEGLVTTPSDFGLRSDPPSHPELLDWLATRFVEDGWSTKALHRRIVLSHTYRQASRDRAGGRRVDPENRLLWRANPRRLGFEATRDAILAVSGRLDLAMGGRSVALDSVEGVYRRTVYGVVRRLELPGVFKTFDFPDPHAHCPRRQPTTVPQQALHLMNDARVIDLARHLAGRAEVAGREDPDERIRALYRLVYGRAPAPEELALGLRFVETPSDASFEPEPSAWSFGTAVVDREAGRVTDFRPLTRFEGEAWILDGDPPPRALSFTDYGGVLDTEAGRAAVRRWTASRAGEVSIDCPAVRLREHTDFAACIVSSRHGELARATDWVPDPPPETSLHEEAPMTVERTEVEAGDTIDFVVEIPPRPGGSWYILTPTLQMDGDEWSSAREFGGPPGGALGPWERYAHTLLLSNEFVFVD